MRKISTTCYWFLFVLMSMPVLGLGQNAQSQKVGQLAADLKAGTANAEDSFWQSVKSTPLIEPIAGNSNRVLVTFLFKGSAETKAVMLYSPLPSDDSPTFLSQVGISAVWARSFVLPTDSRFTYALEELKGDVPLDVEGRMKLKRAGSKPDSLAAKSSGGQSLVELSDALPYDWCSVSDGLKRGSQVELTLASKSFGEDRPVTVFLPSGFRRGESNNLVILFDHEAYGLGDKSAVPAQLIVDNLMDNEKIGSTVLVTIHNVSDQRRMDVLTCNAKMTAFLADELIPKLQLDYNIGKLASKTLIGGSSLGGLQAIYCGMMRPDRFGAVLSQGGSLWYFPEFRSGPDIATEYGWLNRQMIGASLSKTHFYLQADLFEQFSKGNPLMMTRSLRDILLARGFRVTYQDLAGGHEYLNWKASFGECLIKLLGK
ncbi:MAG: alpha/beta hydrolase-fold protein [Fimbriimonadaceae bacterium]